MCRSGLFLPPVFDPFILPHMKNESHNLSRERDFEQPPPPPLTDTRATAAILRTINQNKHQMETPQTHLTEELQIQPQNLKGTDNRHPDFPNDRHALGDNK